MGDHVRVQFPVQDANLSM